MNNQSWRVTLIFRVSNSTGIAQLASISSALSIEWQAKNAEDKAAYLKKRRLDEEIFVDRPEKWHTERKQVWKNMCQLVHSFFFGPNIHQSESLHNEYQIGTFIVYVDQTTQNGQVYFPKLGQSDMQGTPYTLYLARLQGILVGSLS